MTHHKHMAEALRLAADVAHDTAPNPAVGCVLTLDGEWVGQGATQPVGGHHAEVVALGMAGARAQGSTAYVTLEPCAHQGRTPPCATALIEAGVARVFVACLDPDPRVNGKGVEMLAAAGVEVHQGVLEREARALNRGFLSREVRGRPWVCFKTALSIDGRTATETGESQWISGAESRAKVHWMRHKTDAVLIGAGTARADDPRLTARVPNVPDRAPWRVLVTSDCRLPETLNLFTDAYADRTIVLSGARRAEVAKGISDSAIHWIECASDEEGRVDMRDGLTRLGQFGLNHILCESGPTLAATLWAGEMIDEVMCFRAPIILGAGGRPAWNAFGTGKLSDVKALLPVQVGMSGPDIREHYLSPVGAELVEIDALKNLQQILQPETA